eukprot:1616356-Pyramimonas_sp.AAC.1
MPHEDGVQGSKRDCVTMLRVLRYVGSREAAMNDGNEAGDIKQNSSLPLRRNFGRGRPKNRSDDDD